jgi:peptidoglycan biosynthesis protein MviN/MurJ (putative lipid II flippase)
LVDPDAVPALAAILFALAPGVLAYGLQGHLVRVLAAQHRAPLAAAATASGWLCGIASAWFGVRRAADSVEVAEALGLGFSLGLMVGALLLGWAVIALDGREALHGVASLTAVTGLAAAAVGGLGHWLWSGDDVEVVTAVLQSAAAGVVALLVVGGAALLVDPQSARALLRAPRTRAKATRAGADGREDD